MPLDLTNDFKLFDGMKPVTLIEAGTAQQQIINHVATFGISIKDAIVSDGTYTHGDLKFNLPAAECLLFKPKAGGMIIDADNQLWSIGTVETLTLGTRFLCWCVEADINPATAIELRIYRPHPTKDDSGAPYIAYVPWKITKGHVNELVSEIKIENGRKRTSIRHQIYIVEPLDIQAGFQVRDANGDVWNVARVTQKGNMGQAMILDVEVSRSPMTEE